MPDWPVFFGIVLLLLISSATSFYAENKAGTIAKALMNSLALKAKVHHDGKWSEDDSADLAPGDTVAFGISDVIPTDHQRVNRSACSCWQFPSREQAER